ncbi:carbon-nitrogen hydrolase [Ilyonectria destructans]|nr:carbon-nitrogen hydrolase [Ilyonectria destructans]
MAIAAVGQICATASIKGNLDQCVRLVGRAAAGGAKILFLPEASDYIALNAQASLDLAESQSTSPFVAGLQDAARTHGIAVHVGIHHRPAAGSKLLNRNLYIDAKGAINDAATYDKLHVFDYGSLKESATVQPGPSLTAPFDSPVGRIGSLICFDLRFPEAALALAQPGANSAWAQQPAQILTYPSAFTLRTGVAHWEVLLRARAIETQSWVIAAAQVGLHNEKRASYGHSIVVDPWGKVMLQLKGVVDAKAAGVPEGTAEDGAVEELGFVDIDLGQWERIRSEMPLKRRTDVYPELTPTISSPSLES